MDDGDLGGKACEIECFFNGRVAAADDGHIDLRHRSIACLTASNTSSTVIDCMHTLLLHGDRR